MKQHPDNLFREKLEQHTLTAPQNAWSRIEKKMPASHKTFFVWKVAAAILIPALSIALLIPGKTPTQSLALTNNAAVEKQKNDKVQTSEIPSAPKKKEEFKKVVTGAQLAVQEESSPSSIDRALVKSEEILAEEKTESIASLEVNEQPADLIEVVVTEPIVHPVVVSDEPTTIVLTAAEVNTKYLLSPSAQATSEAETTSSFRKLIDKAASFKNNTSGLAELRQKKNEMLALNTEKLRNRNEKNERNN